MPGNRKGKNTQPLTKSKGKRKQRNNLLIREKSYMKFFRLLLSNSPLKQIVSHSHQPLLYSVGERKTNVVNLRPKYCI